VALRFAGEGDAAAAREARPGCHRHAVHECLGPCVAACTRSAYAERVEAARAFLLGKDLSAMRALEARMLACAEALQFEQAARQRDRWALVRWAVRRMRFLRRTRRGFHAIYAAPGRAARERTWYLIRGGVVVAVLPAPETPAARAAAMALLRRVYTVRQGRATYPDALEGENLELVARWFRDRPEERAHLIAPEAALARLAAQPLDRSDA
jgi:excinuclease ABC subunit C